MTAKTRRAPQPIKKTHRDIRYRFQCTECKADQTVEASSFKEAYQELGAMGWQDIHGWKCNKHIGEINETA